MSGSSGFLAPPRWTTEQLRAGSEIALARFVAERTAGTTSAYADVFDASLNRVTEVFERSSDLTKLGPEVFRGRPELVDAARFLTAPPVSRDDLKTLSGGRTSVRSQEGSERVAEVIRGNLDPRRFPWLDPARGPTKSQREAAIRWTTSVWAIEQTRTARRTTAGRRQEDAVAVMLQAIGFQKSDPDDERADNNGLALISIRSVDQLRRGRYRRETPVAGTKSDVPIRLRDGRLLCVECKESNSVVNSVKRLVRETGGKAARWRDVFGQQVLTTAVIAGVFGVGDLERAQNDYGVFIVWEHDLGQLRAFLERTN